MANIEFGDLSLEQGFNYQKDAQYPVGFINTLTIGGTATGNTVVADLKVQWPDNQFHQVCAVLKSVTWDGGMGDPFKFKGNVSAKNKSLIETLRHSTLNSTNVTLSFIVWDFDQTSDPSAYYQALCMNPVATNPAMTGLLFKESNKLSFGINLREATEIKTPKNYEFSIDIMPAPTQQEIMFSTGVQMGTTKYWGITTGAPA